LLLGKLNARHLSEAGQQVVPHAIHVSSKTHLLSAKATLAGVLFLLVLLGLLGLRTYRKYQPEPGIDETGVVTVVSVIGGYSGKFGGRYDHRVRLESGSEGIMTFPEMFARGARVWVSYRRYPRDDRFEVRLYARPNEP
jgi:hypothetical protein